MIDMFFISQLALLCEKDKQELRQLTCAVSARTAQRDDTSKTKTKRGTIMKKRNLKRISIILAALIALSAFAVIGMGCGGPTAKTYNPPVTMYPSIDGASLYLNAACTSFIRTIRGNGGITVFELLENSSGNFVYRVSGGYIPHGQLMNSPQNPSTPNWNA
jgi:hypothetical protein